MLQRSNRHTRRKILGEFSRGSSIANWAGVRSSKESFRIKVSELKNNSPSGQLFWQTAVSIVMGVLIGLLIISVTHKRPAEAVVKSTLPGPVAASNNMVMPIQILPMLSERMTVLLMGVDSNGRETQRIAGTRSDTMILLNLDPIAHKVGMVSIPRDSRLKIAGNHGLDKVNSAHAYGGAPLAVQTISENFSIPIDHYVVVDTQGLKELCQLLGPVEVLVEKDMRYHDWAAHLHIDLKPGLQVLSPEQVEQYVRFRHDARGDIGRIERQQWFFRSAAKKLKDPQFLLRLPDLVRVAHDYVQTDLSLEDMARIATFGKDLRGEDVVTAMLPGQAEMINGGSYWIPDIDASRAVFDRILGLKSGGALIGDSITPETTASSDSVALVKAESEDVDPAERALAETALQTAKRNKPVVVALKYCKASEIAAKQLEGILSQSGYRVRYMWMNPEADCRHEQIVQNSGRADESATEKLREVCGDLKFWPVVLQLDPRPISDFTIVVAPDTALSSASPSVYHPQERPVIPN